MTDELVNVSVCVRVHSATCNTSSVNVYVYSYVYVCVYVYACVYVCIYGWVGVCSCTCMSEPSLSLLCPPPRVSYAPLSD